MDNLMRDNDRVIIYQLFPRLFGNQNSTGKLFGTLDENGCGKFNDITEKALEEIKLLGVTHIWFTGILEHATCTDYSEWGIASNHPIVVKGMAGSPYAIKDYYNVSPDLALHIPQRLQEFESLLQRCDNQGLKKIIDFVPNHVARQYCSKSKPDGVVDLGEDDNTEIHFNPSNNFYYVPGRALQLPAAIFKLPYVQNTKSYIEMPARATGNDRFTHLPDIHDWYETVKLNYGVDYINSNEKHFDPVPDTWHKMLDILNFWAEKGVDGFRCDMAEMVPVEFWQWAIGAIKAGYPDVIFIAEIYNPNAYRSYIETGGFDFMYDKVGMYDTLRKIITEDGFARQITLEWQSAGDLNPRMLRFLENHDEQRIASRWFASEAEAGLPGMGVIALMGKGPVMVYNGQETGENAQGALGYSADDGRTSIFDYGCMPQFLGWTNKGEFDGGLLDENQQHLRKFYQKLLNLAQDEVFARGELYDLMWNNPDGDNFFGKYIFTFFRFFKKKAFLIVASFSADPLKTHIQFPDELLELLDMDESFSVYGKDLLWDGKEFFSDGREFAGQGLTFVAAPRSVYAFSLEFS